MTEESGTLPQFYAFVPRGRFSAQHHYRVVSPVQEMVAQGYCHATLSDEYDPHLLQAEKQLAASIIHYLLPRSPQHLSAVQGLTALPHVRDGWAPRPLVVFDSDDYDEAIDPLNPSFVSLGTRNPVTQQRLVDTDTIKATKGGEEYTLWEHGEEAQPGQVFNAARNAYHLDTMYQIARQSDMVTVTCEPLAEVFRARGCKNIHVYPNSMPLDYWNSLKPLAPRTDGTVRVLWQGGSSHVRDLLDIREALVDVMRKHPHATLVWWGDPLPGITDALLPGQVEMHSWVVPQAYIPWRGHLDCDINLAPLIDTPFNRAKSAIKWYEGSVLPRPEATLARNIPPYTEIQKGDTGLLYDTPLDFAQKLTTLIDDAALRQRLGEAAKAWVTSYRSTAATVPSLWAFYTETANRIRSLGETAKVQVSSMSDLEALLK